MEEQLTNYEKSGHCLICNDYFEEKPLLTSLFSAERDQPIVVSDNDRTANQELLVHRWKAAFQLFSRLLNSTTEEAGAGYVWDTSRFHLVLEKLFEKTRTQGIFQSPCCSICSAVLFEIVKLQEAIEENMKLQEERVHQLKQKLSISSSLSGQSQDDNLLGDSNIDMEPEWDNISIPDACSDFSVETVVKSKVKVKSAKRKRGCPSGKRQVEVAKATDTIAHVKLEIRPCVVLLERLSDNSRCPTEDILITPAPSTSRERRSKLRAQEIIRKSCVPSGESLQNEFEEVPVKNMRKSSSNKKKRKADNSEEDEWKVPEEEESEYEVGDPAMDEHNNNDDIESNSKRQRRNGKQNLTGKRNTILGTHLSRKLVGPRRVARSDLFFLINDNFLFHKSTVIEVYLRHKMICKEANCAFEAQGIDSSAFDMIREHIITTHMPEKNYSHIIRSCPICEKQLSGHALKIHLIEHHQVANVVCEICWKPLQSLMPRTHMFRHKNEEERRAAIEDGHDGPRPTSKTGKVRKIPASIRRLRTNKIRRIQPNNKKQKEGLWFRTVNDEYLIYKLTLVRFTFNQSFQCGEFDCSFTVSGTYFDSFQEMRKHLATHLESRGYFEILRKCPLCSNSYLGFDFKTHFAEQHHLRLVVICEICWRPLGVKCMQWMHLWTHKNDEEKALEISLGDQGKSYEYKWKVKSMSMSRKRTLPVQSGPSLARPRVSGLNSFECEICQKKLPSRRLLQGHIERVHRPDLITNPLICEFCGKKFHPLSRWNYKEHVRAAHPQTDDINVLMPFICDCCGARFKWKKSLKKHRTAHHSHPDGPVRLHQCEFCELTFLQKQYLTRHQFCVHSDRVPAGMENDPKMMKVIRSRERAKDFIGPRRAYPCEVCGKVYLSMNCFTTHKKKRHGINGIQ